MIQIITRPTSPLTATKTTICRHPSIHCSYLHKHFCCSIGSIQSSSIRPRRSNHSYWSSRFWLHVPKASKNSSMEESKANIAENSTEKENDFGYYDYDDDKYDGRDGSEVRYDRESFSKLLLPVPFSDAKLFSQMALLCNMAYVIPEINAKHLRMYYGLHFVTSSFESKIDATKAVDSETELPIHSSAAPESLDTKSQQDCGNSDLPGCENQLEEAKERLPRVSKIEVAPYVAVAAATLTANVKDSVLENINQEHSSRFEWFICDDPITYTRIFVIQGPNSLASWQSMALFEPTLFEGKQVFVHKGIYEAAKLIYEQVMSKIMEHLQTQGDRAKLQFTGHSLEGSISVLITLMLLTRKNIRPSNLKPVVTYGSPFVLHEGQKLLDELMLDETHIYNVIMHRDIVPRCFSCNYPHYLTKNEFLCSPLGKLFIVQPNEKTAPPHPWLPPGAGIYALYSSDSEGRSSSNAMMIGAFFNCPHPVQTLLDVLNAYGSEGSICKDHDSCNYLKAINEVVRMSAKRIIQRPRKGAMT